MRQRLPSQTNTLPRTLVQSLWQDLDEAMPAYYASIKALDSLDKKSIQEMKSFSNPPQARFRHPLGHRWRPEDRNEGHRNAGPVACFLSKFILLVCPAV